MLQGDDLMARNLNQLFLAALKEEFPFLKAWNPQVYNTAERPVTFEVKRTLEPTATFHLEYGRYNNDVDGSYTCGITGVGISDGENWKWIALEEGATALSDVIRPDTRFMLTEHAYRSMLVYNNPGSISFTLYKVVPTGAVIEGEKNAAARMKAELA